MERTWCPSLGSQVVSSDGVEAPDQHPLGNQGSTMKSFRSTVKDGAAVAANSSVSAEEMAAGLSGDIERRLQKFHTSVVSSNRNKSLWPLNMSPILTYHDGPWFSEESLVCLSSLPSFELLSRLPELGLPTNRFESFFDLLVRHHAVTGFPSGKAGLVAKRITLLGSTGLVIPLSELLDDLQIDESLLLRSMESFTVCDAPADEEPKSFENFVKAATSLKSLSLVNCSARNMLNTLFELLKESQVECVSLERNDLGVSSPGDGSEGVAEAVADYLRYNKFIISLNLAHNNLDAQFVKTIMDALVSSNTVLSPEDLPPEPEVELTGSEEPPVSRFMFLGDEDDAGEETESEVDEGSDDEMLDLVEEEEDSGDENDSQVSNDEEGSADEENDKESDLDAEEEEDEGVEHNGSEDDDKDENDEEDTDEEEVVVKLTKEQQIAKRKAEGLVRRLGKLMEKTVREEGRERKELLLEYVNTLEDVSAGGMSEISACAGREHAKQIAEFCTRRSGWSHIQSLILRGNQLGDRGAISISRILRDEIPLTEEEFAEQTDAAKASTADFLATLSTALRRITSEESRARKLLVKQLAAAVSPSPASVTVHIIEEGEEEDDEDEEDEYAREAPPVLLTNIDDENESDNDALATTGGDEDDENGRTGEDLFTEGEVVVPVSAVRSGMRSLRYLDLASCNIGPRGLQALAAVLRTDTIMETLILRCNPFGSANSLKPKFNNTEAMTDENNEWAPGDVTGIFTSPVSPGFVAFAEMLRMNKTLHKLDLGYCQLQPAHVRVLASALSSGTHQLTTLCLDGNELGADIRYQHMEYEHSYLYELWMAIAAPESTIAHLNMSHNDLAMCLWQEEFSAFATVSCHLQSFYLSNVGLSRLHVESWVDALHTTGQNTPPSLRILHLSRNKFGGDEDGAALGSLLWHCAELEELSLDDHPLLVPSAMACALEHLPLSMRRLSCDRTGLSAAFCDAALSPIIPAPIMEVLHYLSLSDIRATSFAEIESWGRYVQDTGNQLRYLSLWSRCVEVDDGDLQSFVSLVEHCPSLRWLDTGILPISQCSPERNEVLMSIEKILTSRS